MTQYNNFMSLYGFAFVISGLRRISFDIHGHPKKKKQEIHVVFVKKKNTANWVVVIFISSY